MSSMLNQPVPSFRLMNDCNGEITHHTVNDGRYVVLYFYPKDDTPGCTKESIAFSQRRKEFEALDATVIGVSKDSISSHQAFKKKHNLTLDLLSDPEGALCEAFAVWKQKSIFGALSMGIERSTFLINPKGIVIAEWRKVKVDGHVDEVLAALKQAHAC